MAKRRRTVRVRQGPSFKGRQFTAEGILWAVRWSPMFPISYRDLALMLADRGVEVDHTTTFRWVQAYAPELISFHPQPWPRRLLLGVSSTASGTPQPMASASWCR